RPGFLLGAPAKKSRSRPYWLRAWNSGFETRPSVPVAPPDPSSGDVRLRIRLHLVPRRPRVEMPAGLARAQVLAAVEGLEHAEEVLLDVLEVEEFLVHLRVAGLAEPHQAVV